MKCNSSYPKIAKSLQLYLLLLARFTRINGTLSAIFDKLYASEMHTRTVSQTNIIISIVPLLVVPKTSWEIKSAIFLRFLWVKFKDA